MKNDQLFDDLLKSRLENLTAPYDAESWAAFEEKLDLQVPESGYAVVDDTVLQALEGLEMTFNPAHWDLLDTQLSYNLRLRRRIWITKIAEVAIFLLLLLNLDGLLYERPRSKPDPKPNKQVNEPVATRKSRHNKIENASVGQAGSTNSDGSINKDSGDFWTLAPNLPAQSDISYKGDNSMFSNASDAVSYSLKESNVHQEPSLNDNGLISLLDPLPVLNSNKPFTYLLQFGAFPYQIIKKHRTKDVYASVSASVDQNSIWSGTDLRKAGSISYGASIGVRKGKWGIETGVRYSNKNYQPKKEEEIWTGNVNAGYMSSYADQVNVDLVSVPLEVSRRIAHAGKTTVRATVGATANFAVQKDFHYKRIHYPGAGPSTIPSDSQSQPTLEKTAKGLLENGSLDGNFYATVDAGLRFEHPVGRKLTMFIEPSYHAAFTAKGIGPNPSRIHTGSLQAGVMASL